MKFTYFVSFYLYICLKSIKSVIHCRNCLKDMMSELQCEQEPGGEGREQGGGDNTEQGGGGEEQEGRSMEEQEGWMREEQETWWRRSQQQEAVTRS